MTWTTGRDGGVLAAEMEALATLAVLMAAPLEVLVVRQMAATLLNTYLGLRSGRQVLAGLVKRGDGETIHAVIWLSDLRGFAALSEKLPRDDLIALLNVHFERLSGPIRAFGGEVLKFMGDGLLAIFPIGEAGQGATPATAAVRAARSAITSMRQLNEGRRADRKPQLRFGVALHVGDVHYGNIGSPDRLDFTAIGPAVNLASRLERLCKRLRCPVLMSGDFAGLWGDEAVALGRRKLRGLAEPVDLYTLPELAPIAPAGRASASSPSRKSRIMAAISFVLTSQSQCPQSASSTKRPLLIWDRARCVGSQISSRAHNTRTGCSRLDRRAAISCSKTARWAHHDRSKSSTESAA
jgi:adenylate cyclase